MTKACNAGMQQCYLHCQSCVGYSSLLSCSGWQHLLSALCGVTAFHGNPPDLWNDGGDVLSESCAVRLMCLYAYLLPAGRRAAPMVQYPRGSWAPVGWPQLPVGFIFLLVSHFLCSFCFWQTISRSFLGPCWRPGFVRLPVSGPFLLCSSITHVSIIWFKLWPCSFSHISRFQSRCYFMHVLLHSYSSLSQIKSNTWKVMEGKIACTIP